MVKAFDLGNIVMHVMFISAFLGIYFFTFGAYLERTVLQTQIDFLVDDIMGSAKVLAPNISANMKNIMNGLNMTNINKQKIKNEVTSNLNSNLLSGDSVDNTDNINNIKSMVQKISAEIKNNSTNPTNTDNSNGSVSLSKFNLNDFNIPVNTAADEAVEQKNKQVMTQAFKFILAGFVIGFIVIYIIGKNFDREGLSMEQFMMKLIKRNLFILCFIALTEFGFAYFFAKNYMSININGLKKSVIDSLIKIKTNVV
jgi:hypothetical protein